MLEKEKLSLKVINSKDLEKKAFSLFKKKKIILIKLKNLKKLEI